MIEPRTNWAGNYTYTAARWHHPTTVDEVRALVAGCARVRVLGSRHSFNAVADCPDDLVSLERLERVVSLDRERGTVTVDGGIRYGELCGHLEREGYALHNLASLPHISVAGACATATHGSGDGNGNLATAVAAVELVAADGELITLSRDHDGEQLRAVAVGLGAFGVVTKLTLDVQPRFAMRQDVYEELPLAGLEEHFDAVMSSGYSVSLFTDWRRPSFAQLWVKRLVAADTAFEPPAELFGATLATHPRHPIAGMSPVSCTEQLGVAGSWHERLPHFRMDFTPSSGDELQSEYLVPRQHALAALRAIDRVRHHLAPLIQVCEVRTVAADDLWMSPCRAQPCVAIHFTWTPSWRAVEPILPVIEQRLAPFDARPHWGKLFTMAPARLQSLYGKLADFRRLAQEYDPLGKFRNAFVDTYIGAPD